MPKRRKTREQKMRADHRQHVVETVQTNTFSLPSSYKIPTVTTTQTQSFLQEKDLQKTLLVSTIIIALQILLFSLLKNHTIVMPFPGLRY